MTDREKHLEVLEKLHDSMRIYNSIMLSTERIEALAFAISSIKTDLKYNLLYEGEEVYTKADMVAMLEDLILELTELDVCGVNHLNQDVVVCDGVDRLIQEKIDKLKEVK